MDVRIPHLNDDHRGQARAISRATPIVTSRGAP